MQRPPNLEEREPASAIGGSERSATVVQDFSNRTATLPRFSMRTRLISSAANRSSIRLRVSPRPRHRPVSPSARDTWPSLHPGSRRFVAVTMQTSSRWPPAVSAPSAPSVSLGVDAAGAAGPLGGENRCPNGSRKVAGTRFGSRRLKPVGTSSLPKSGRWDSNRRRPAWEGGRKTRVE